MYEFWYDYLKPSFGEKLKLYYMDAHSFVVYIKTNYIHKDIAEDVKSRFHTLNYELDKLLPEKK